MNPLRYYRLRTANAVSRMRIRGHRLLPSLLLHFPRVVLFRAYRVVARRVNRARVFRWCRTRALERMHAASARPAGGGHFYVIVMPRTLHYLLPCLAMLPEELTVFLVVNGAARWECGVLARHYSYLPMCRLARMPGTSLTHGDVITALLATNTRPFGLLDHDCYVFDRAIFRAAIPGPGHCVTAVFGGTSVRTGLSYPETYWLCLDAFVLRDIMKRYHVDARVYHTVTAEVRDVIARIGLCEGVFFKDNKRFFDTLHVLLALALAEGHAFRFLQAIDAKSVVHVGGTSWQTNETKDLVECYIDWRFLEHCDDAEVRTRYAPRFRPFRSGADVRAAIPMTPEAFAKAAWVDELVARLAAVRRAGASEASVLEPA